jgi:hypothetical protein
MNYLEKLELDTFKKAYEIGFKIGYESEARAIVKRMFIHDFDINEIFKYYNSKLNRATIFLIKEEVDKSKK